MAPYSSFPARIPSFVIPEGNLLLQLPVAVYTCPAAKTLPISQPPASEKHAMRPANLALLASALILTFSAPGGAQSPPQSAVPTLKVYSREIVVDVTVTDAKGNPVHGLTRDNFTIKEDGKPQPIHSFEAFSPDTSEEALPDLPPNTYTNRQPPPSAGAINLFLLDGLNTAPPDATDATQIGWSFVIQQRVKRGAAKYLASMPAGTRVAILGLSNNLHLLQAVSSDPALLSAAVDTMQMNMDGRAATMPEWCAQQDFRNRATLEALTQLATDAAQIKGRKNLLWFSAGFPTITDPRVRPECLPDYNSQLFKTYAMLAAAQVTISPVGARGLGAEIVNPSAPGIVDQTSLKYMEFVADEQFSLEAIADATGGTAYYNTNDLAGTIAKAVDAGSDFYTISYVPPGQKYDKGHHTTTIAVDQPGLTLVYRKTYDAIDPATIKPPQALTLSATPPEIRAGDLKAVMSRNMPLSTQIVFNVYVEPGAAVPGATILGTLDPKLRNKPLTRYSFLYSFPAKNIAFTPSPDGSHHGAVALNIAAYDAEGKLVTGLSQTVTMPLSDARFQQFIQGPFRFAQQLDLPSGQLFLRIGVLDPTSNKVGTLEIPLTVPKK
jgi:VWFA-related protein